MSFKFPISSGPSTPERSFRPNGIENDIDFPSTPGDPFPSVPDDTYTPIGPPPDLSSSLIDIESPVKINSFTAKESVGSDFLRINKSDELNLQNQYEPQYQENRETSRDKSEERDEAEYSESEDHESSDSQHSYEKGDEEIEYYSDDDQENPDSESFNQEVESNLSMRSQNSDDDSKSKALKLLEDNIDGEIEGQEHYGWQEYALFGTSKYREIAQSMYSSMAVHPVEESDDLILATEAITLKLYQQDSNTENENENENENLENILARVSDELVRLWETYNKQTLICRSEEYTTTLGPGPQAPGFSKANFIASLTLRINYPKKITSSFTIREAKLPQTLIEWMDEHHNPYPNQHEEILAHKPSPSNHALFWDSVFNCLIRGKIKAVIDMINNAGWEYSKDVLDNINNIDSQLNNSNATLTNVERAMDVAKHILMKCPATHRDWNSRNNDWKLFRLRALQALEDLKRFNEGRDLDLENDDRMILEPGSFNETAKKARSLIPWNLYQNLVTLYNLLMGDISTILANSQDWCEATIGLVIWWDESKKDQGLILSRFHQPSRLSSKYSTSKFFHQKLRISFEAATSDSTDFQINSADDVQVALASLFQIDYESVIGFLRCWSGPVSCGVVEIASLAGWLPRAEEKSLINMGSLDQGDFELLGLTHSTPKSDDIKDKTLITYANNLSKRRELKSSANPETKLSSWEVSIAILGRLDSTELSVEIIRDFLDQFPLEDSSTVNKLWILLNSIGLTSHAESAAQRYADDLAGNSHKYGEALYYYALAHNNTKVKNVLDLLISSSLAQSSAYPSEKDLDDHLRSLLTNPQIALTEIATMDYEAARLLHSSLSGYATLRKFYDLRDEPLKLQTGKNEINLKSRKIQASVALIAVITSSSDHISGGLHDTEHDAVVHVDFLLALLGEAIVFVNQPDFILTVRQIETLLYAIEDLNSIPPNVYTICSDFFYTVMESSREISLTRPQHHLKMGSNRIGSHAVGNSLLASQLKQLVNVSGKESREMTQRGWDWRDKVSAGTTADELLKLLRLGLAKDLAKAWLLEVDEKL
ncbi:putative nuclear pore complex subunit nup85 [Erysiphe necator]|uniref:Nuclear pore complex protein Nup85 n=1 Tax=Uncinula necator TaxID=52586 RepID=A0A0B1PAD6_UNCNE|nr:putative nuclear pore complex subunit nup85 [Erysiphe necator]